VSSHPVSPSRIAFLESIRGLAAVQVLLLHVFSAFWPDLVSDSASGDGWSIHSSPLYVLYDGHAAVYIFFVLSGYVLSRSFESHLDRPLAQIAARAIRLGLPALAAVLVSAALLAIFGRPNIEAGAVSGSEWFASWRFTEMSALSVLRDGIVNALLLGYPEFSSTALLSSWQQPHDQAFVPPLWTLSIEFHGSLLVLSLCLCARRARSLWWAAAILLTIFTIRNAYFCFVVGHLLASWRRAERPAPRSPVLPIIAIALGVFLCLRAEASPFQWLRALCGESAFGLLSGHSAGRQQKMFGAIFVLIGLIHLPWARAALSSPALVRLSRLSFPLYLVHWPVLMGPTAVIFLQLNDVIGLQPARFGAAAAGIGLSCAAALLFDPIDRNALALSRRWREHRSGTALSTKSGPVPSPSI
jgi:peptidoglycan/LPS O-acetylase OafA/YrhL